MNLKTTIERKDGKSLRYGTNLKTSRETLLEELKDLHEEGETVGLGLTIVIE